MRRQAAEISEHDAASRLSVPGTRDEISALATTMNDLLARLHDSWRRQGAFVADAGHELRTPLAVLRTELELADRPQRTEQELREAIQHTSRGVDRLAHLTEDLLLLARTEGAAEPRLEWVHLGELIADAVGATGEQAGGSDVRIVVDGPAALDVRGVRSLLRRALDNLLENAVRYSPRGATVTLRTSVVGDEVVIAVLDEGPGFTPGFLPHAFERFRRADDARSRGDGGTGLGLAIVLAVAEAHGGTAAAANRPEGGAIVTVTIPHRRSARTSKEM